MRSASLALFAFALTGSTAMAQDGAPVSYSVSFPNAVHHEAEIAVNFADLGDDPLTVQMSRASPGRYAIHEFAKNVYSVAATDGAGNALEVAQSDPYSWVISGHDGTVNLTYTLFADRADGTYSQIDLTHAHLNAPATYIWGQGLEDRPVEITFYTPDPTWQAATQLLTSSKDGLRFTAPDLQYFMDSPVELSDFELRSWQIGEGTNAQTVRMAIHHDGNSEDVDVIVEKTKKIVSAQIDIFGEAPRFDNGVYTFIADYVPHASGDGMEHRNSTILTGSGALFRSDFSQLGTISHEFFHAWNVERLRPADLEPFDFTRANPSKNLWFAEGFTSYYGPLAIRRAGEESVDGFLESLGGTLGYILNAPGRELRGPRQMSLRAPFVDAATAIDPTNNANTFLSYYPYGAMVALALDLSLRGNFDDVTLDDYMRYLWQTNGKSETPYTNDDLRGALASVTGDDAFATAFFANYIENGDLPDYAPLFEKAGLEFAQDSLDKAWIGGTGFETEGDALHLASGTQRGTPLYLAGLDRGDEIVSMGRVEINSADDVNFVLDQHAPGDELAIAYVQRGVTRTGTITLGANPSWSLSRMEKPNRRQKKFLESWIGTDE